MVNRLAAVVALLLGSATVAMATVAQPPPTIPEPSALMMLASGLGGAIVYARNRRRK